VTHGDYPHLSRPPLREALIDIRLSDQLPVSFLDRLRALSLAGLSNVGEIKEGGFKLEIAKDRPVQATITSDQILGMRFQTADASQVLQYRRNGITFSILKNYQTWEDIRDLARTFWQQFLSISGTVNVNRLAVRYVNAIEVPLAGGDFDEYLTAGPRIPNDLPQQLTSFLLRVVIPFTDVNAHAIITQALEPPTETSFPAILDIDAIGQCSLNGADSEVWNRLEQLRIIKNRIFFASVTAKALEVYR
jgi:uncharacterized protein (TIGR04255 family)